MKAEHYRWIIVAAGGLIGCVAAGAMFSLPVLLRPIAQDTGWSMTGVSTAMTIGFITMAFAGFLWGHLSDRFGARAVVIGGSVLLVTSFALTSQARSLLQFQLLYGIAVGGSTAAMFVPMMACVTGWFDTHRSLAVSLVSAGMGMAPLTMSPLVAWLVLHYDWRAVMLLVAALAAVTIIPAALLVRRAPMAAAQADANVDTGGSPPPMRVTEVLRSPLFIVFALTNFFCCATHSGPIVHTISYAVSCGIPLLAAVSIYSVEGLAGMGGRIVFGLLGDRFGARRILVLGLLAQAFGALAYFYIRDLGAFYAVASLFGFIYAGTMPLYAVLARENFPLHMLGTVIGAGAMAGGLGMATGPVTGGLIFDAFGSYGWLFITSFGLGIGAFLMALLFKPMMRREAALASA